MEVDEVVASVMEVQKKGTELLPTTRHLFLNGHVGQVDEHVVELGCVVHVLDAGSNDNEREKERN